jgi:hypothetical protein
MPKTSSSASTINESRHFCSLPVVREREFPPSINLNREQLIRVSGTKWVNGTVLHYFFFDKKTDGQNVVFNDGTSKWVPWTAPKSEKEVVREAFQTWTKLGIGLKFEEVTSRTEAELRIGFMQGDGSWSYIGREVLSVGANDRTMNLGWKLAKSDYGFDTALHEIGHSLGFPHEHQNPNAGIVWDEEAVYADLGKSPNFWNREKTHYNIIRKLSPGDVSGSAWDPNSIMHYEFGAGLIKEPEPYRNGLKPAGGISECDRTWALAFYPPLDPNKFPEIVPFQSQRLALQPSQQANFVFKPRETRPYTFQTFGRNDLVMVLFEEIDGDLQYLTAEDDSALEANAQFKIKLLKGRKYVLRVRMYYNDQAEEAALMVW